MIKTGISKRNRAMNGTKPGIVNGTPVKAATKKKESILDFAGTWNELPAKELKALDTVLSGRRKSVKRSSL